MRWRAPSLNRNRLRSRTARRTETHGSVFKGEIQAKTTKIWHVIHVEEGTVHDTETRRTGSDVPIRVGGARGARPRRRPAVKQTGSLRPRAVPDLLHAGRTKGIRAGTCAAAFVLLPRDGQDLLGNP